MDLEKELEAEVVFLRDARQQMFNAAAADQFRNGDQNSTISDTNKAISSALGNLYSLQESRLAREDQLLRERREKEEKKDQIN